MKKLVLVFLMSISLCGVSQNPSFSWGPEIEKDNLLPERILGEYNGEIFLLKENFNVTHDSYTRFIETFSSTTLNRTGSFEIKVPKIEKNGSTQFINIFLMNGKLIMFFSYYRGSTYTDKKYDCYSTIIDKTGNIGEPMLLFEHTILFEPPKMFIKSTPSGSTDYNVITNSDSSNFLLYLGDVADGKLKLKIISPELKIISENSLDLPFTKTCILSNFILDNKRMFYFTAKEQAAKEGEFNYKVFAFDLLNKTSKNKSLPVKATFPLTDLYMKKTEGKLQILSYYYDLEKIDVNAGGMLFYELYDTNLELKTNYEKQFNPTTITQLNSNNKFLKSYLIRDDQNSIKNLTKSRIIEQPNGEIIIISEQYIHLYMNNNGPDYYNILVTRIDPKTGINSNQAVIPKMQTGIYKSFYSYLPILKEEKLLLIYNDNGKNSLIEDPYKIKGIRAMKGTVPVVVTVDKAGKWDKKQLFTVDANSAYIFPAQSFYTKSGEIILFGKSGKSEENTRAVVLKP